jgi:hypothetical protein
MTNRCQCKDSLCPTHIGYNYCDLEPTITVYQSDIPISDMDDLSGTEMCDSCGNTALISGLFHTKDTVREESL